MTEPANDAMDALAAMSRAWAEPLWDEAVETCASRVRALGEMRPSDGLIERQNVDDAAIRYGQALLSATADELLKLRRCEQ